MLFFVGRTVLIFFCSIIRFSKRSPINLLSLGSIFFQILLLTGVSSALPVVLSVGLITSLNVFKVVSSCFANVGKSSPLVIKPFNSEYVLLSNFLETTV